MGGPGEDLEHLAPPVPVGEHVQLAQYVERDGELAQPSFERLVVAGRGDEELHAAGRDRAHRGGDVRSPERQVLHSGSAVRSQEVVDLPGLDASCPAR